MKTFLRLTLGVLLTLGGAVFAAANEPVSAAEASGVVNAYTAALKAGNTDALANLLGGNLLAKRQRLWRSSEYPTMLVELYAESVFSIASVETGLNGGQAMVRVNMTEGGDSVEKNLILMREGNSVRIIDERLAIDQR